MSTTINIEFPLRGTCFWKNEPPKPHAPDGTWNDRGFRLAAETLKYQPWAFTPTNQAAEVVDYLEAFRYPNEETNTPLKLTNAQISYLLWLMFTPESRGRTGPLAWDEKGELRTDKYLSGYSLHTIETFTTQPATHENIIERVLHRSKTNTFIYRKSYKSEPVVVMDAETELAQIRNRGASEEITAQKILAEQNTARRLKNHQEGFAQLRVFFPYRAEFRYDQTTKDRIWNWQEGLEPYVRTELQQQLPKTRLFQKQRIISDYRLVWDELQNLLINNPITQDRYGKRTKTQRHLTHQEKLIAVECLTIPGTRGKTGAMVPNDPNNPAAWYLEDPSLTQEIQVPVTSDGIYTKLLTEMYSTTYFRYEFI